MYGRCFFLKGYKWLLIILISVISISCKNGSDTDNSSLENQNELTTEEWEEDLQIIEGEFPEKEEVDEDLVIFESEPPPPPLNYYHRDQVVGDLDSILTLLEEAAVSKDVEKMIPLMDEEYIELELNGMCKGDKGFFMDKFFSGYSRKYDRFKDVRFSDIKEVEFEKLMESIDGFDVFYSIETEEGEVDCFWVLKANYSEDGPVTYKLIGTLG